jgi:hypothetical protein
VGSVVNYNSDCAKNVQAWITAGNRS